MNGAYASSLILDDDEFMPKMRLRFWSRSMHSQPMRLYPLSARMRKSQNKGEIAQMLRTDQPQLSNMKMIVINTEERIFCPMSQTDVGANQFTFTGEKTQITYFPQAPGPLTLGVDPSEGKIEYQGIEGDLTFTGNGIQKQTSPLGTLLTVILQFNNDAGGLQLTLLVPPVTGVTGAQPVTFETLAIKTSTRGFIVQSGATISYEVLPLLGTASDVILPFIEAGS
jgi:hypothetical protein